MNARLAIVWNNGPIKGRLQVIHGRLAGIRMIYGQGSVRQGRFQVDSAGPARLETFVSNAKLDPGSFATLVSVRTDRCPFTFFLRDVDPRFPIVIAAYGVAVTSADDKRAYAEIAAAVRRRRLCSELQRIEREPEEDYARAAAATIAQNAPTWLGVSRDMRIFEVRFRQGTERYDRIYPRYCGKEVSLPETENTPIGYHFTQGRGVGAVYRFSRRLDKGALPILHSQLDDGDIRYSFTVFSTLESGQLKADLVRGTHFLAADSRCGGHALTARQQKLADALFPREIDRRAAPILCYRVTAVNLGRSPCYAWLNTLSFAQSGSDPAQWPYGAVFEKKTGFSLFPSGRIFCISKLNGQPLRQREIAVLLHPGARAALDLTIPHRPVSRARARKLAEIDFDKSLKACRSFWLKKLNSNCRIRLPERRVEEMVRAGLLHLDLITYGREPNGPLAATIGVYSPIGSESAPIMQFFDSMGWHAVAERAGAYFLEKQHDDGLIQNFNGYMLENGAALWTLGEHFRYTRDLEWIRKIRPGILKACNYLIRWRRQNMKPELRGRGYGLISGKVGDPNDACRFFMLNGYACLGLARAGEMLAEINAAQSAILKREAQAWKRDIRKALLDAMARSPVIPLGNGGWIPSAPPWTEYRGPVALQADGGCWWTHGTIAARDSLAGPLHLVFLEVIAPCEPAADILLNANQELLCVRNVAFSQPYYSRHDYVHLQRGEVKAFLKAFYNGLAGLADRETYTFWEHFFGGSPHKTHEEAWFLMQTRWMLWLEDDDTLRLLAGIPRAWLADGNTIEVKNAASYFGPLSFVVRSRIARGVIEAEIILKKVRLPRVIDIRLPHLRGRKAVSAEGGIYYAKKEAIRIPHPSVFNRVRLAF